MGVHVQHSHLYDLIASNTTIDQDNGNYYVNTSESAVTLTIDNSVTHFTVFDSYFNFGANNCTVDFGGGTTKVMSLDGEVMVFFKDGAAWRFISVAIGNGGAV